MYQKSVNKAFTVALVAVACVAGEAAAQTVTVDASNNSPDNVSTFNLISTAVASFATGGANAGNAAENIINVAPGTPVVDKITADVQHPTNPVTIDGDLTIQGDGGLATLAGQPLTNDEQVIRVLNTPALPSFAWRQNGVLTLKDIAVIPTDPAQLLLAVVKTPDGAGSELTVNLDGCVFTANNGSNAPLTTTGQDDPDVAGAGVIALGAGGDAFFGLSYQDRGDLTINVTNSIFASFAHTHNTSDGLVAFMQGAAQPFINTFINVNEGCVFANSGRAIQNPYGGFLKINGTAENPVVIRSMTGTSGAVWTYSDGDTQPSANTVNYARFYNLAGSALYEAGPRGFFGSVTNSVIANCGGDGMNIIAGGALPLDGEVTDTITIDNTVFHDTGVGSLPGNIYASSAVSRNMNITNSVFTGAGTNGIVYNGTGVVTVSSSILSTNGENGMLSQSAGSGTVNMDGTVTDAAVTYVNTTDPFAADFFEVAGSAVNDWSVY